MAYLAPIHQPSSVRHAVKLNFLSPEEECLIVAKASRLEIYIQTPDGLSLRHSRAVYGRVTMLNKLRPASSMTDHLFVGTDRFMYFTVSWNSVTKELETQSSYEDMADKSSRDSQTGDRCLIDPSGRFMTLELFEGVITVIPIAQKISKNSSVEIGNLMDPMPVRISEMFIRASAFIETRAPERDNKPKLALLYEDTSKTVRLKIRPLTYSAGLRDAGSVDLEEGSFSLPNELELGSSHLIPVSSPACGVVILGETSITYYEHSSEHFIQRPLKEATIFVSWEQIDRQRFVLADEYGKLYLLMLELDDTDQVEGWRLDVIGETSRASVLVYLDAGNVFVGSHQGDSQVITIKPQSMDIIQTFPNIGPILDFTIMDMGNRSGEGQMNEYSSGQARLVTGSGAFKDGSLRSVRSGVGLEDLGMLGQMENITDMFSLKSQPSSHFWDTLLVSFVDETRIFHFGVDGDVEEQENFAGFSVDSGTLYAANISNGRLIQVTNSGVQLTDADSGMVVTQWAPAGGQAITAVTAHEDVAVVSVGGTTLAVLDLNKDLVVRAERSFTADSQVACVHVSSSNPVVCLVGFWNSAAVSILGLDTLETIHTENTTTDNASVPRSLLLVNILEGQPPTLFISMADGNVITYTMDPQTSRLSSRRSIVLGTQQANFRALPRGDGLYNVFATCDHPSLIYGSEGRIIYSAVTAENASCICPFDAQAYPGAIAIATSEDLKLALVDEERSTHVQGLHVGETIRRIAYSPELRAFGLGTIKRTLQSGVEVVQSHFKLADEVMFNVLATWKLNEDELVESVMRCQLDDGSGKGTLAERFVVGTAYLDDDRADSVRGRIIILEVTEDRGLKLVAEHSVKGACRCLAMVAGKIVAALIKTVVVYDFKYDTPSVPYLTKAASYRTSTAPIDIHITPSNIIAIADLMKSVSLVQYSAGTEGRPDTLIEVARHFQTTWGTAVAHVDMNLYLESDAEGNLIVLQREVKSEFSEDLRRLKVTSEMLLGEMVNKIKTINVPASVEAAVAPKAFLATVEGSIYLFGIIAPSKLDLLLRLQENITKAVKSPGNIPFNKYRAFKNQVREAEEPYRFVDGELVERFLELDEAAQENVVSGLGVEGVDVDGVRGMVEALRRLR